MIKGNLRIFYELAFESHTLLNSIRVAVVVGGILNLINQGDVLVTLRWEEVNYIKLLLTFLVPFSVSSYAAGQTKMTFIVDKWALYQAKLKCKHCKKKVIQVFPGERIPPCTDCVKSTRWKVIELDTNPYKRN